MNTISIIIPHHNGYEILNNCLKSLYASDLHNSEIIIVDNCSTDNSINKNQEEFSQLKIIRKREDLFLFAIAQWLHYLNSSQHSELEASELVEIDFVGGCAPLLAG